MRRELGSLVGGTIGGALGTAFMQKGMQLSARLPEPLRPPPMHEDPAEHLVHRFESKRGRPLAPPTHDRAARTLHWIYGIGWSNALAIAAPRLGMHRLGRAVALGAAMGAGVWAVGYLGWLPRLGLTSPVREQGVSHVGTSLASHVVYGVLAALPIYAANRIAQKW